MTPAWFWTSWATIGLGLGAATGWQAPRLLQSAHRRQWMLRPAALAAMTGSLYGFLAWRLGAGADLVVASILIAAAVPASVVDALEQRLPVALIWPGYVATLAAVAVGAALRHDAGAFMRCLAGMAALVACYGLIALVSRGGIGLGDVRLAGLLGLSLGWTSWHAVVLATVLAFGVGGLVGLAVLATGHGRDTHIPFGPIMTGTALAVLAVSV